MIFFRAVAWPLTPALSPQAGRGYLGEAGEGAQIELRKFIP